MSLNESTPPATASASRSALPCEGSIARHVRGGLSLVVDALPGASVAAAPREGPREASPSDDSSAPERKRESPPRADRAIAASCARRDDRGREGGGRTREAGAEAGNRAGARAAAGEGEGAPDGARGGSVVRSDRSEPPRSAREKPPSASSRPRASPARERSPFSPPFSARSGGFGAGECRTRFASASFLSRSRSAVQPVRDARRNGAASLRDASGKETPSSSAAPKPDRRRAAASTSAIASSSRSASASAPIAATATSRLSA